MAVSFESDIDILYGIGGAPEGIVSAAAVRALEGNMQARLLLRKDVKGETEENLKISESELLRCSNRNNRKYLITTSNEKWKYFKN